ncbi:hypothetical protein [Aurantimonas coralicida]|uniref:hypothetical protein n=1 Tax=Aurantimonas coralicida TaxID=182270 RepID=UPI001D197EC8|nr:hypothetical protein [Aurantimonas coralicida]MCC4300239.1 hypothetical protein [Aurantimonas coralicida]
MPSSASAAQWVAGTIIVCILGISYVYYPVFASGFQVVTGDMFDAKIMVAILEHWHNVLRFQASPWTVNYFYPYPGTLAYCVGLILTGIPYSVFRTLGADPFLSYELTNWTVRIIGAIGVIVVSQRFFRVGFFWAMAAGLFMLIATNMAAMMGHAQLSLAALIPFGLALFHRTFTVMQMERLQPRTVGYILAFAGFVGLWALTEFYTLFTFCLFICLYFAGLNVLSAHFRTQTISIISLKIWRVAGLFVCMALAVALVLKVYGPALGAQHSVEQVRELSGSILSFFNIGSSNALWSSLLSQPYLNIIDEPLADRWAYGYTPIFGMAFVTSVLWLAQKYYHDRTDQAVARALALAIAAAVICLLSVRIGGYAMWEPFFRYVPGAQVVRVPVRMILIISPIIIIVTFFGLSRAFSEAKAPLHSPVIIALLLVMIAGQHRTATAFKLNRTDEVSYLASLPPAPDECQSFYAGNPRIAPTGNPGIDALYLHSVDAMVIAEVRDIPTINGMATFVPEGWNLVSPDTPDYDARAKAYAEGNGINDGLCRLDLTQGIWTGAQ